MIYNNSVSSSRNSRIPPRENILADLSAFAVAMFVSRSPHEAYMLRPQLPAPPGDPVSCSTSITFHLRRTEASFVGDDRVIIVGEWTVCFRDASRRWAELSAEMTKEGLIVT